MDNNVDKTIIKLTDTDFLAINSFNSNYLNNKGAKLYESDTYYQAVEYYRIASAMGNDQACSNLGYCYLYGRDIEQNTSLALAYFKIASLKGNIDASYKLGDIYGSQKWGYFDKELSNYYYTKAVRYMIDEDDYDDKYCIIDCDKLREYPSLCYAMARELSIDGSMITDLSQAYQFLKQAEIGYKTAIANGCDYYQELYQKVLEFLKDEQFDIVREDIDEF